ncbi:MAG: hypothetical protein MJ098_06645 [Saccharofermentans sp.]|nr:hypothetical protein [Saccharofermentans sp.]
MLRNLNSIKIHKFFAIFTVLLMAVNMVSCSTSQKPDFIVLNEYVKFDTSRNRRMVLNVLSNKSNPDVSVVSIDGDGLENIDYKWSFDNEAIAKSGGYRAYMILLDFDVKDGCTASINSIDLLLNGTSKTVSFTKPAVFRSRVGLVEDKNAEAIEISPIAIAITSDKVETDYDFNFIANEDLTIVDISPNGFVKAVPVRYSVNDVEHETVDNLFPLKLKKGDECNVSLKFSYNDGVTMYDNISCDLEIKYYTIEPATTYTKIVSMEFTNDVNAKFINMVLEK